MDSEPPIKKTKVDGEPTTELEKLWKTVEEDPTDFTGWTYLLQHVDANCELFEGENAYDQFLFRYPYCYGYWKKYADLQKRKSSKEKCLKVFEKGLKAIPLSADLWIHYLNYVRKEYEDNNDYIRSQYERALASCGQEWRSDKLWDHFVKWEVSIKSYNGAMQIYERILRNPTQGLSHQFEMFKEFIKEHNPSEFLPAKEYEMIRKEVADEAEKANGKSGKLTIGEENQAIKDKLSSNKKKLFKKTEEQVQKRWKYEDNIKRPYFHIKPLERGQLKNWNDYIDFEIKEQSKEGGDEHLIEILFERCLIACALYEEFWEKYINWLKYTRKNMDTLTKFEKISEVYERVCLHHLPDKIDIHISYASFEEEFGNHDKALKILKKLEDKHPDSMNIPLRIINLERRRGNIPGVKQLYQKCISKSPKKLKADLVIKYSRFLRLAMQDYSSAFEVVQTALNEDPTNNKLHLQCIDIAVHQYPIDVSKIYQLFDQAMKKTISPKYKLLFSERRLEFLEDFGTDVKQLMEAHKAHTKLNDEIKEAANKEESSDKSKENNGVKPTPPASGAPPSGPNGAADGYSAQYQQQYGSNYGNYYGNYGSYPQGYPAGYGSYPPPPAPQQQ